MPLGKTDRRLRYLSRSSGRDRRKHLRYFGKGKDVNLSISTEESKKKIVIKGKIEDVSQTGMLVKVEGFPENIDRVELNFNIPGNVMEEEFVYKYKLSAIIVRRPDAYHIALRFRDSFTNYLAKKAWRFFFHLSIYFFLFFIFLILLIKLENVTFFWFDVPIHIYGISVSGYLLSRFLFAALYRPPVDFKYEPTASILMPCRNEEEHIQLAISKCMETDYPKDKLEVIVIDDGSTDRTFDRAMGMKKKYPELEVIKLEKPLGKRRAIAKGIEKSTGEILIFTDADSFIESHSIRKIVQGLADPTVAAVTGHIEADNKWDNLLTKMQAVRYFVAFRIMKASESIFSSVTCCSGPLSAYRRDLVLKYLDKWTNQKFLGTYANFGDDRTLTRFLLKKHRILYDSEATATSHIPKGLSIFLAQQLRWKKSWFRESLLSCSFMWKKLPLMAISFYLGFLLPLLAPVIVFRALVFVPVFYAKTPLIYLFGIFCMSSLFSISYMFFKRSILWFYLVPFSFFYMFALVWQMPYAIITVWNTKWGTK